MNDETTTTAASIASATPPERLTWKARLIGILVGALFFLGGVGLFILNHKIAISSGHLGAFGLTGILIGLLIVAGSVSSK
jgi:hypothetical protein